MKRILYSLLSIGAVAAVAFGATQAFFSDTETSEDNTFVAGALDLKIDSEAHYNGMVCEDVEGSLEWHAGPSAPFNGDDANVPADHYPQPGDECVGTWAQTDLSEEHIFFSLTDVKPGDEGENTISLHVINNDAWGQFTVANVEDLDNSCTEPEIEAEPFCEDDDIGELGQSITFDAWLDQGGVAGFQCNNPQATPTAGPCSADPLEGNNIQDDTELEQLFWDDQTVDETSEGPFDISDVLSAAYIVGECTDATGNTNYGECHGLAEDGRIVGSATYYFGLAWNVPDDVGNEAQTDSLEADLVFDVEQHRNNPTPFSP